MIKIALITLLLVVGSYAGGACTGPSASSDASSAGSSDVGCSTAGQKFCVPNAADATAAAACGTLSCDLKGAGNVCTLTKNVPATENAIQGTNGYGYSGQSVCAAGATECTFPDNFDCGDNTASDALCTNNEDTSDSYCVKGVCANKAAYTADVDCGVNALVSGFYLCEDSTESPKKSSCLNNACVSVATYALWCGVDATTSTFDLCKDSTAGMTSCLAGACVTLASYNDCGADALASTSARCTGSATLKSCLLSACVTVEAYEAAMVVVSSITLTFSALLIAVLALIA